LRADLLDTLGDPEAPQAFERALVQRPLSVLPPSMLLVVDRAERVVAEYRAARRRRLEAATIDVALDPDQRARVERFASNTLRTTRPFHAEPTHFHYPGLPEREFHERAAAPWIEALERETPAILGELQSLIDAERTELQPYISYSDHEPKDQWRSLDGSTDWTAIHLIRNGVVITANADQCPRTMAALSRVPQPQVRGCSPNAMFSLLAPGTRIPPHHGVSNTRLICHLPLIVPEGCHFRVGATTRNWERGRAFLFDDSIEHEAANDGEGLRIVLIFDVWHPALVPAEREAVGAMMAADVAMRDKRSTMSP
jgi:aspartyl/asparaginyl beta-hydroxylase (cupin superfamily)